MGMQMGVPMGMQMGVPMGQMGMQMGQMGVPMGMVPMGMMPMMQMQQQMAQQQVGQHMGVNPNMGAGAFSAGPSVVSAHQQMARAAANAATNKPQQPTSSAKQQRDWLVKELEAASEELANKASGGRQVDDSRSHQDYSPPRSSAPSVAKQIADAHERESAEKRPAAVVENTPDAKEVKRCHLHPQKKPNAKCKFCQRAQQAAQQEQHSAKAELGTATASSSKSSVPRGSEEVHADNYSRRTFNCSPMLKDQILGSSYFKSLLSITGIDELIEEITQYADTLDVYNSGSNASPSCFICQVYRLFTLPDAEDLGEIATFCDHTSSVVRCSGFMYMRFVVNPMHLWEKLEEYVFDAMHLQYEENGHTVNTTIGEYVEGLLGKVKYFGTPLPRIPVKARQMLEKELAPMAQYRKRMIANQNTFRGKRIDGLDVEVCVDGQWICGTAKEYVGRVSVRRRVRVVLEDGSSESVHLGKVVLRDADAGSDSERSGSEGNKTKRKRSRSRGGKNKPIDWSRNKGKSQSEMAEEYKEKSKEEAVCTVGKSYSKRPDTMEEELWKSQGKSRVSMLGDDGKSSSGSKPSWASSGGGIDDNDIKKKLRRDDELERMKRQREIYEKYGSTSSAAKKSSNSDMDRPDVLRLG